MAVGSHNGWPEEVEIAYIVKKAQQQKAKRDAQMATVCGVLDKMPTEERRRFISAIIKHYKGIPGGL